MISWLANICFAISFAAFSLGTFGLYRLPDPYTRIHGLGISDTLGVGFVGLGLFLLSPSWILRVKILFVLVLYWLINPTMTHLVAKAGLLHGTRPVKKTKIRKG